MQAAGDRSRPAVALATLGVLAVLVLGGVAARSGSYVAELPPPAPASTAPVTAPPPPTRTAVTSPPAPEATPPAEPGSPVVGNALLVLLLLLGAVGLGLLVWWLARRRWRLPAPRPGPAGARSEDPATQLPEAVDRALAAIEQPDAREAVVQAWLLLGAAAAAAGTPARPAETAAEYAERLADAHGLPPAPVHRLAGLYREARFSAHPVSDAQRAAARAQLDALRAALTGASR